MEKTCFDYATLIDPASWPAALLGYPCLLLGAGARVPGVGRPQLAAPGLPRTAGVSAVCDLFTDAEITTAVGRTINKHDGVDSTLMGQSICTYEGTDLSTPVQVQLFYNQKAMQLYLSTENSAEHIDGLGDDAFWNPALASLFVRKGDHAMQIVDSNAGILSDADSSTIREGFKALAQKAVAKI